MNVLRDNLKGYERERLHSGPVDFDEDLERDDTAADKICDELRELMTQLREMKLMALQRRVLSAGIADTAVEDAMECADPKSALIALVVEAEAHRDPD